MNESSVSSPLMRDLRLALTGAEVVKHRDTGMVGLPDCSVTYDRRPALWLEFKFYTPLKTKVETVTEIMAKFTDDSPTQYQWMRRAAVQGRAFYITWVRKTEVILWHPITHEYLRVPKTKDMVALVAYIARGFHADLDSLERIAACR